MMLPNLRRAILRFSQPLIVERISTTIDSDGKAVEEVAETLKVKGVSSPLKPEELQLQEEGERWWLWRRIHTLYNLKLKVGDNIRVMGKIFRVRNVYPYNEYGFYRYDIQQNYRDDE